MKRGKPLQRKTPLKPGTKPLKAKKPLQSKTPLKAKTALQPGSWLARNSTLKPGTKPLQSKTPINPINEKRLARLRKEQFGGEYREYIIRLPCALCGVYRVDYGSQPAHVVKTRGAGGKAHHMLPLCAKHHQWQEEHRVEFAEVFTKRYKTTPEQQAETLWQRFHAPHI
jgi:hypothetical protein